MSKKYPVICLSGSTRYKDLFEKAAKELTLCQDAIILMPNVFGHSGDSITDEKKKTLDEIHLRKIDMCDMLVIISGIKQVILDCGENEKMQKNLYYVGESTKKEIEYAQSIGTPVKFFSYFDFFGIVCYDLIDYDEKAVTNERFD